LPRATPRRPSTHALSTWAREEKEVVELEAEIVGLVESGWEMAEEGVLVMEAEALE